MAHDIVSGEYEVGDDISDMVNAVSGEDYVGAARARRQGRPVASPAASPGFMARTKGDLRKRSSLGFGAFSLVTLATVTLQARVQRGFHPDRLLVVATATGILLMSVRVGDEEQLLNPGVSFEAYGVDALADSRTDDFTPAASGMDLTVMLYNPTAGTISGSVTMKGAVIR